MDRQETDQSTASRWIVITTINGESAAGDKLITQLSDQWSIVIVGDRKTPDTWNDMPVHYLSIEQQYDLFGMFAREAPHDHYCRKNFGYLYAMGKGADCILETDDDNVPYDSFGRNIEYDVSGRSVGGGGWLNVYSHFTNQRIWPRGLPLDSIMNRGETMAERRDAGCPIQQYLADTDPDVDAIYRLVFPDAAVDFDQDCPSVIVDDGTWVPFNSQNTVFFRDAFPLLYLPHHVSFRMTDIWRSFVAQCALWQQGKRLAFHCSTVRQDRNVHDLNRDFEDEVPGYVNNRRIGEILEQERESSNMAECSTISDVAVVLWRALVREGIIPEQERPLLDAWFSHMGEIWQPSQQEKQA